METTILRSYGHEKKGKPKETTAEVGGENPKKAQVRGNESFVWKAIFQRKVTEPFQQMLVK